MQVLLWLKLAVCSLLLFWIVKYWIEINRKYNADLVRNYKHGWPYRFAGWKNFKAIIVDGIKAARQGDDSPRIIPLATVSYPKWVIERAEKEGPCDCCLCQATNMVSGLK